MRDLLKCSQVIGLPVICVDSGKRAGIIKDVLFCPDERLVKGFLLERKGFELDQRILLMKDVLSLGNDAVIVSHHTCILPSRKHELTDELKGRREVRGLRIYARPGVDLGIVADVMFDGRTGRIEGVEASNGILQDIVEGRSIIPLIGKVEFGSEIVLVDREALEEMTNTHGGIKRKLYGEKNDLI